MILRYDYGELYASKLDKEMNKFLEMYNLPKANQEEMRNLSRPIISNNNKKISNQKNTKTTPPNRQKLRTR